MNILLFYLFKADVWGTVSDWVMVTMTSVTAYFLYKTLKSQKDVQNLQYNLVELEQRRFADTIKPIFNGELFKREVKKVENGLTTSSIIIKILNTSLHKATKAKAGFLDREKLIHYIPPDELPKVHPGKYILVAFTMRADHSNVLDDNNVVKIIVRYTDEYKTTYVQKFEYIDSIQDIITLDPQVFDKVLNL